jgi:hypothetical protein
VGRVLAKFQEARAVAYADDVYIKAKLSVALQVLAELKAVFKAVACLELNVSKTSILPKGTTQTVCCFIDKRKHSVVLIINKSILCDMSMHFEPQPGYTPTYALRAIGR